MVRERQQESEKTSNFSSRLREAREMLRMTQEALGELWGVDGNYIYMLEAGTKDFPKKRESLLLELEAEVRKRYGTPASASGAFALNEPQVAPAPELKESAPVVSWASAGRGGIYSDLEGYLDEVIPTDCKDPNKYALIVEGDSMLPKYEPGDRIVVAPNFAPVSGKPVVARLLETGTVLFKVYNEAGRHKVILTSYNPVYPPREFKRTEFRFIQPVYQLVRKA